jgi:hypothetical protein
MNDELDEIGEILDFAENEWVLAKDNNDFEKYTSAEKLFLLAINKASEIYPDIYARLSWLYMDISLHFRRKSDDKNYYLRKQAAEKYANLALKHDPENLTAHFIKTWIFMNAILNDGKLFNAGDFNQAVEKFILLFEDLVNKKKIDASETLFWGEKLMVLTDYIREKKLNGEKEIYRIISKIEVNDLDYSNLIPEKSVEIKKDIRSIKFKAESQLL